MRQQIAGTFTDKTLQCKECGKDFTWTAGEQSFFQQRNFQQPKRCPECRTKKQQATA